MNLNPLAVVLWVFCALVGLLIDGDIGALVGLTTAIGLSLLVEILVD